MEGDKPINQSTPTPPSSNKYNEEADQSHFPLQTRVGSMPENQPVKTTYAISHKAENTWWDEAKPWVEFAGVILLAVYTFYTVRMFYINRRATEAAEKAATAAQSAASTAVQELADTEKSAGHTMENMDDQTRAQQRAADAEQRAAAASEKSANAALISAEVGKEQLDGLKAQASARLVFQNFKVTNPSDSQNATVSFDLANVGGSVATEISEQTGVGGYMGVADFRSLQDVINSIPQTVNTDPSGFPLDKGQSKSFQFESNWYQLRNGPRPQDWYRWDVFAYRTVFGTKESICILSFSTKAGINKRDCSLPIAKPQP